MQEFTVSGLAIDSADQSPVVLLRELDDDRVLPLPPFISYALFQEEFGFDSAEDPERGDRLRQRLECIDPEGCGDLSL